MADYPPPSVVDGQKIFIPLENNPTALAHLSAGIRLSPQLTFHDILSPTDPDLLAIVPRPCAALILLADRPIFRAVRALDFPAERCSRQTGDGQDWGASEAERAGPERVRAKLAERYPAAQAYARDAGEVVFVPQTIGHACGTMALVHTVLNLPPPLRELVLRGGEKPGQGQEQQKEKDKDTPGGLARALADDFPALTPEARSAALYASAELERAHQLAASTAEHGGGSDTAAPRPEDENQHHFMSVVADGEGRVWELEGGGPRAVPIYRGKLKEGEDLLGESVLGEGGVIGRYVAAAEAVGEVQMSLVAAMVEDI